MYGPFMSFGYRPTQNTPNSAWYILCQHELGSVKLTETDFININYNRQIDRIGFIKGQNTVAEWLVLMPQNKKVRFLNRMGFSYSRSGDGIVYNVVSSSISYVESCILIISHSCREFLFKLIVSSTTEALLSVFPGLCCVTDRLQKNPLWFISIPLCKNVGLHTVFSMLKSPAVSRRHSTKL